MRGPAISCWPPGTRLAGPELAIAASAGLADLEVSRAPRIAIFTTGDELVEPGEPILDTRSAVRMPTASGPLLRLRVFRLRRTFNSLTG